MPPMVASAPGSMKKQRPLSRSAWLSCLRVRPASTVASMSSALSRRTRFMRVMSRQRPPRWATTCPSSEVPAPNEITGTR